MRAGAVIAVVVLAIAASMPAKAQLAKLPADVGAKIAAMGPNMGPAIVKDTFDLFRPLVAPADSTVKLTSSLGYGPDERKPSGRVSANRRFDGRPASGGGVRARRWLRRW